MKTKRRNYWKEERGFNSMAITSRGWAALDNYEYSGPILFVGGPKHNQFMWLTKWYPVFSVADYQKVDEFLWESPEAAIEMPLIHRRDYRLQKHGTDGGAIYFVYECMN